MAKIPHSCRHLDDAPLGATGCPELQAIPDLWVSNSGVDSTAPSATAFGKGFPPSASSKRAKVGLRLSFVSYQ